MNMARLKVNPYAGRRAYRRTSNVASATAAPTSRSPTTHDVSNSELLTSTWPATSTAVPFASRMSYLEVASNAAPTPLTVTTPLSKGSEMTDNEPMAPPSPEGKGPAPCLEDTASAELAVTSAVGVSFSEQRDLAIRVDHLHTVRALLAGLSFEDKCSIVGVAPLESGMCVETAAGEGGAIVPIPGTIRSLAPPVVEKPVGRKKQSKSRKLATKLVDSDEIFARALQAEEHAAAEKIAAAVAEDERLAWSLSDSNYSPGSRADATSLSLIHI